MDVARPFYRRPRRHVVLSKSIFNSSMTSYLCYHGFFCQYVGVVHTGQNDACGIILIPVWTYSHTTNIYFIY